MLQPPTKVLDEIVLCAAFLELRENELHTYNSEVTGKQPAEVKNPCFRIL